MSGYLLQQIAGDGHYKSAAFAPQNWWERNIPRPTPTNYADNMEPGPGNWIERTVPGGAPTMWDKVRYQGEKAGRHGIDALTAGANFMAPRSGAEALALAGGVGATGIAGSTARAMSPIGAAAPMFDYFYNQHSKGDDFLRDKGFQRAAAFAAAPLIGKLVGDVFGIGRRQPQYSTY